MKKIFTLLLIFTAGLTAEDKILLIAADDLTRDWISAYKSA